MRCSRCQAPLKPEDRFCGGCGLENSPAPPPDVSPPEESPPAVPPAAGTPVGSIREPRRVSFLWPVLALLVGLAVGLAVGLLAPAVLPRQAAAPPPPTLDGEYYLILKNRLKGKLVFEGETARFSDLEKKDEPARFRRSVQNPPYFAFSGPDELTLQLVQSESGDLLVWIPNRQTAVTAVKRIAPPEGWDLLGDWDVYAERELNQLAEVQLTSDRILAREPGEAEARSSSIHLLSSSVRPLLALTEEKGDSLTLLRLVPLYPGCYVAWEDDRDEPAYLLRRGQPPDWSKIGVQPGSGPR